MTQRHLYIACYDISNHCRHAHLLKLARRYATGGQKSVHEIYLTPAERDEFVKDACSLIDEKADRFLLVRIDPRCSVLVLGKGAARKSSISKNDGFFCVN